MIITALTKGRKNLSSVFVDGEFFAKIDSDILSLEKIKVGNVYDTKTLEDLVYRSDFKRAKDKALYILEHRDNSKKELIKKLERDYSKEASLAAANCMEDLGLINDEAFAKRYANELIKTKLLSKFGARAELLKKGIDKEMIENLLEDIEVDATEQIKLLIEKKYKAAFTDEKIKRRCIAFLQRKGYRFDDIYRALKMPSDY